MPWLALLLLFADPFWQARPAADWNDLELARFLADSPWAQMALPQGKALSAPPIPLYLATAAPIAKAVEERNRRVALRRGKQPEDVLAEEYQAWFEDNRAGFIIVAVRTGNTPAFSDGAESRRMEQESVMDLGRIKVKPSKYFPPTPSDPYLRLAFPRGHVSENDKSVSFVLYLPGVPQPYRSVQFKTKDMVVDGKLEM
jgi:hypothetical protein